MKKILPLILLLTACELPPRQAQQSTVSSTETNQAAVTFAGGEEEYVMVTPLINLPLYVNHDQKAFLAWGKANGVKTSIIGPADWDIPNQIAAIEQVIGTRPAGLLINGTDPGIAQAINRAVAAGIPTVVYDSDIKSNRNAFLGTDWYEMGRLQGEAMARHTGGKGKVACLGILGLSNQEAGFRGVQDALKKFPNMEYLGKYGVKGDLEDAARVAADLMAAHPDLAGLCGFTSETGPGIALAVKEAGKVGKVKITTVDAEAQHLKLVKEGVIQYLVGQKRELFTWYGAQFLHDLVHRTNALTANDRKAGVVAVPSSVSTGQVEIDAGNVDLFLKK